MTRLQWDQVSERLYETGLDRGVLYTTSGLGVAWNGLASITESPSGAEATAFYASNRQYLNIVAAEKFGGTIEAFTYPDEFALCDGSALLRRGVRLQQQRRQRFNLSYRTNIGNDVNGISHGYKIHIIYNALAAPSEKAYKTINESPEAVTMSWSFSTTPAKTALSFHPTSHLVIDSTEIESELLAFIEDILYGTPEVAPKLLTPDDIAGLKVPVPHTTGREMQRNASTNTYTLLRDGRSDLMPSKTDGVFSIPSTTRLKTTSVAGIYTLET